MRNLTGYGTLLLAVAGLVTGCAHGPEGEPRELELRSLAQGAFSRITENRYELIRSPERWAELWEAHIADGEEPLSKGGTKAREQPEVDFEREMVVAALMGRQRTGGYSIEVRQVSVADDELRVVIVEESPAPGAMTIQALTAPFHFVAIPKIDLPEKFIVVRPQEGEGSGETPKGPEI